MVIFTRQILRSSRCKDPWLFDPFINLNFQAAWTLLELTRAGTISPLEIVTNMISSWLYAMTDKTVFFISFQGNVCLIKRHGEKYPHNNRHCNYICYVRPRGYQDIKYLNVFQPTGSIWYIKWKVELKFNPVSLICLQMRQVYTCKLMSLFHAQVIQQNFPLTFV